MNGVAWTSTGRKNLLPLAMVLSAMGCAQRDLSLVGQWEAFTETHRDVSLELRQDGSAEFQVQTWIAGERQNAQTTRLAGRWSTKEDVVIVAFAEGEAQYRYSVESSGDPTIDFLCRGLTPIEGFDLVGTDKLWNPEITLAVAEACLSDA